MFLPDAAERDENGGRIAASATLLCGLRLLGGVITLTRDVYDDLIDHAREGRPEEICGVLGGTYHEEETTVTAARRAANVADRPRTRYYIDPEEQLERIDELEEEGQDVAGFYHSHPAGPTEPSETDAARATWPGYSYVIVALDGHPYIGSWRWDGENERFEQEVVRVRG